MYRVVAVLSDNKRLSGNFPDLNTTMENVGKLFTLDTNSTIKYVEILPEWSGDKICQPVDNMAIDPVTKKEL